MRAAGPICRHRLGEGRGGAEAVLDPPGVAIASEAQPLEACCEGPREAEAVIGVGAGRRGDDEGVAAEELLPKDVRWSYVNVNDCWRLQMKRNRRGGREVVMLKAEGRLLERRRNALKPWSKRSHWGPVRACVWSVMGSGLLFGRIVLSVYGSSPPIGQVEKLLFAWPFGVSVALFSSLYYVAGFQTFYRYWANTTACDMQSYNTTYQLAAKPITPQPETVPRCPGWPIHSYVLNAALLYGATDILPWDIHYKVSRDNGTTSYGLIEKTGDLVEFDDLKAGGSGGDTAHFDGKHIGRFDSLGAAAAKVGVATPKDSELRVLSSRKGDIVFAHEAVWVNRLQLARVLQRLRLRPPSSCPEPREVIRPLTQDAVLQHIAEEMDRFFEMEEAEKQEALDLVKEIGQRKGPAPRQLLAFEVLTTFTPDGTEWKRLYGYRCEAGQPSLRSDGVVYDGPVRRDRRDIVADYGVGIMPSRHRPHPPEEQVDAARLRDAAHFTDDQLAATMDGRPIPLQGDFTMPNRRFSPQCWMNTCGKDDDGFDTTALKAAAEGDEGVIISAVPISKYHMAIAPVVDQFLTRCVHVEVVMGNSPDELEDGEQLVATRSGGRSLVFTEEGRTQRVVSLWSPDPNDSSLVDLPSVVAAWLVQSARDVGPRLSRVLVAQASGRRDAFVFVMRQQDNSPVVDAFYGPSTSSERVGGRVEMAGGMEGVEGQEEQREDGREREAEGVGEKVEATPPPTWAVSGGRSGGGAGGSGEEGQRLAVWQGVLEVSQPAFEEKAQDAGQAVATRHPEDVGSGKQVGERREGAVHDSGSGTAMAVRSIAGFVTLIIAAALVVATQARIKQSRRWLMRAERERGQKRRKLNERL